MKLKKRKNQIRFKKKLVFAVTLIILMMLGIGYSFLVANLNIKGNISLKSNRLENTSEFNLGTIVNNKMKELTNSEGINETIKSIKRTDSIPEEFKDNNYIVSDNNSKEPIYMWYEDGIIYVYSLAETLYFNDDSSYMFSDLYNLESIDIDRLDTSEVKNMNYMFNYTGYNTENINFDFKEWNISKVEEMSFMFYNCGNNSTSINIDLSNWNTENVKNMRSMFEYMGNKSTTYNLNLSNWNLLKVNDMAHMFYNSATDAKDINLNIDNWNTENVKDISSMFNNFANSIESFNLDISNWNLSKIENMTDLFYNTGENSLEWNVYIPKMTNELENRVDTIYGKDETISYTIENKEFTIKDS